jgi:two-component sensor histidine kinase
VSAQGPEISVAPRPAVGLSLALHELGTNAVKYGALSSQTGRVRIEWRIVGEGAGALFELVWREEGGPPVAAPSREGFGSRLIRAPLSAEPEATTSVDYLPSGLVFRTQAPLRSIVEPS